MHFWIERARMRATVTAALLCLSVVATGLTAAAACPQPAQWLHLDDNGPRTLPLQEVIAKLTGHRVVLLGESHDNAEHHRWQLSVLAALHARQPGLALGLEMFPRRVQPVLDQWTAGSLSEQEFLARSQWDEVWGYDAAHYMPLFHYARMHRIPMLALNVERELVRRVGAQGWESIPDDQREGVGDPAPAESAYLSVLYQSFVAHGRSAPTSAPTDAELREPQFVRFVQSMQLWDRAMAQAIGEHLAQGSTRMVVGIMGSGHVRDGYGVPHQLRALGVQDAVVLLPWETGQHCEEPSTGVADYLFGVASVSAPEHPRLGIVLDQSETGVVVREVAKDSIAEDAGMRSGDVVTMIAGLPVGGASDVIAAVRRQIPGTWLPIGVQRGAATLELVARFPALR